MKNIGTCEFCGKTNKTISEVLSICRDCILTKNWELVKPLIFNVHKHVRCLVDLPSKPPKANKENIKLKCDLCINRCTLSENDLSYCGLRSFEKSQSGELSLPSKRKGYIHGYLDPIPTNCCNAWFCGGDYNTYSYAAFLYGCSFNCLFCQNSSHKHFSKRNLVDIESLADRIYNNKKITCICYFGGTPEVQLPFTINLSNQILEKIKKGEQSRNFRVCWEWNGSGNKSLVEECMKIAINSGGNIKFDLKAFDEKLNLALCGVSNCRTLENFKYLAENYFGTREENMHELSACTLLVPGYVNYEEVEQIATFISEINKDIPYSLLVFHPDYQMNDLPITSRKQATKCLETAKKYLNQVNLGNKFLLGFS
ncbi:MAG: radical SAM protein [Candidatus Lokiarchaeota archaeon]|nr:radical SAM protein [Candidatus Lokiarchaeota archaeon]